jgi:hypothetical protein
MASTDSKLDPSEETKAGLEPKLAVEETNKVTETEKKEETAEGQVSWIPFFLLLLLVMSTLAKAVEGRESKLLMQSWLL